MFPYPDFPDCAGVSVMIFSLIQLLGWRLELKDALEVAFDLVFNHRLDPVGYEGDSLTF